MALRAKNKLGFIDESLTSPKKKEDIPKLQRCNDLVASWILNSTSTEICPNMRHKSDLQSPPFNNVISINTQILDYESDDMSSTLPTQPNSPPRNSHNDNPNDIIVTIFSSQDDTSSNLPSISVETFPNNPST
ncbi:hypothetical protein KIW84_076368 [Lathyrus oleraceus]|uniref:Uncharacterized protein n=1 Tax=Pisum sativum TaxID=3888 RepID=A0A9D4VXV7_PEA|nr:hypothetical protein KIW84_076368 [Pisum sativum]